MPSTPRVLWLRRRTNETGGGLHETDRTCCGKAAEEARPASFSNDCDAACSVGCLCKWHTLLMALGNAETGKKLLKNMALRRRVEACIKFHKGWSKKQHEMEAASHWTSKVLGTTVYATARGCLVAESQGLQVLDGVELLNKGAETSLARDAELDTS